jgi:hypothetical protein
MRIKSLTTLIAALLTTTPAHSETVWTDWTSQSVGTSGEIVNTPTGTVTGSAGGITIIYSGGYRSAQTDGSADGTTSDFWNSPGFSGGWLTTPATTPPPGSDIITLIDGGLKTITFSKPVTDIFMAFLSWNGNDVMFDRPFSIAGEGRGYFGSGNFVTNPANTGFTSTRTNEVHGILKFSGTFSSLSWTDIRENSRGFQIGFGSAGGVQSPVPEPSSWALMLCGFLIAGHVLRRRHEPTVLA